MKKIYDILFTSFILILVHTCYDLLINKQQILYGKVLAVIVILLSLYRFILPK